MSERDSSRCQIQVREPKPDLPALPPAVFREIVEILAEVLVLDYRRDREKMVNEGSLSGHLSHVTSPVGRGTYRSPTPCVSIQQPEES